MLDLFAKNREYRSFLLFSIFLSIGEGIFGIFMMWVVHAIFQNPMYTGIAGFMFGAPKVICFMFGPFVDKRSKASVLRTVTFIEFIVVVLVLLVSLYFQPGVWVYHLAILSVSITGLFGAPAFTAMMPRIVKGEDLIKANALASITAIIGGLSIGIVLYLLMIRGADFSLVHGVNAVVVFIALLFSFLIHSNETEDAKASKVAKKAYITKLKEGFSFAKKGVMLPLMVAVVSMGFFADIAYVNLPMFAQEHLGTASGYIVLSALALLGGLIGSIISRIIESKLELWKILVGCFVLAGASRIAFVNVIPNNLTRAILIYILYIGLGSAIGIFYGTLIQKLPPKNLIGRVDAVITSLSAVAAAVGALVGGLIGTLLSNIDTVFIIQGSSYIAIGIFLCFSRSIRRLPKISEIVSDSDDDTTLRDIHL